MDTSATTIKVAFRTRMKTRAARTPPNSRAETDASSVSKPIRRGSPTVARERLARRLALAHLVERLIESGRLVDYAHAARILGVSRARLSQLMDLLMLPADLQEQVLLGQWMSGERALRRAILPQWDGSWRGSTVAEGAVENSGS